MKHLQFFIFTILLSLFGATAISAQPCPEGGEIWTARTASELNAWNAITYGNGIFVAVSGGGTNRVMTSTDGINWVSRVATAASLWRSVAFGNGIFVAVASTGTDRVMTSTDGINWTLRTAAEPNAWRSVTFGNGMFLAVAANGTNRVMTSTDGISWTPQASASNLWLSVTYGNGLFVAVSNTSPNNIMTSANGTSWNTYTSPQANFWRAVTYGNGVFVAVSSDGTDRVMTSTNGSTWTARSAVASDWFAVTYGAGQFVAVGDNGTNRVMTSPDAITWTPRIAVVEQWYAVTYANNMFVATGNSGSNRVMTSIADNTVIPAVSITAAPSNNINSGTNVTFTATPTNGGSSPTYQWKVNGGNVGTNTNVYASASLANNDIVTCEMTSSNSCANPTTATSNAITMIVTSSCINPTAYNVTGGGAYCAGGVGVVVGLANSEAGVTYQLQKDNVNDDLPVNGTGAAISFGTKTAAGNYTVIATRTNGGCTNNMTSSVNVIINPTPPINAVPNLVASTNTPCAGTQVLLTATPASGYTAVEYLWSKNGVAVYYQNGGTGTYLVNAGNVAAQVNYSVQIVYGGYSCISSYSANTTLNVFSPTATITPNGAVSFCVNTPTTLQANAGMSNYVWKRSGTVVGTNSATYTPTVSGNHNVTVTDANGCSKTSSSVNITVKSLPTANAGADRPLCEGSSVQIGANTTTGNTYTWSPITALNNPYISNPTTTTTDTITYTLTVNNTITGCSKTDNVVINSLALPQMPSITSATAGNTMILTANSPGAATINWYKNGANFLLNKAPNSSITVAVSNPSNAYTVKSKGTNGCLSVASMPTNARLTNADKVIFTAYPNPTSGLLIIEMANLDMNTDKLLLYNSLGQIVIEKEVSFFAGKAQVELDMSQLATGIYHLSFGEYMQKIVKE